MQIVTRVACLICFLTFIVLPMLPCYAEGTSENAPQVKAADLPKRDNDTSLSDNLDDIIENKYHGYAEWLEKENPGEKQNGGNIQDVLAWSSKTGDYRPFIVVFGVSFLMTWGVGLLPAFIARYAIHKKPLSKKAATWIAGVWCATCATAFVIVNILEGEKTSGVVWILVFFVSRWVMTRGKTPSVLQKTT